MIDTVTVTETITFLEDGGSRHVWQFPDGSTREETFKVAPVMFQKPGLVWGLETARERGINQVVRRAPTTDPSTMKGSA